MLLSCPAKKVTKECGIGEALRLVAPAPEPPSPMYPTRLALTMARSTLTYILSTTKMFRFLPCSGSAPEIRQGGESGAAAVSGAATMCRHVVRTLRSFSMRAGRVHRGGRNLSRGSAA